MALACLLVLAGCSGGSGGATTSTLAPLPGAEGTHGGEDSDEDADPSSTVTLPPISVDPVPLSALVLGTEGLGEARFGDDPTEVIAYVANLLGSPTADVGWLELDGSGLPCERVTLRQVEWGVLRLEFGSLTVTEGAEPAFLGWDYGLDGRLGEEPQGIITDAGVGLGSRIDELRAAYPTVMVYEGEEGTFPPSFKVPGGVEGFSTGTTDTDVITVLKAGVRCGW